MAKSSGFLDTLLTSPTTERYRIGFSLFFLLGIWLIVGSLAPDTPNSMLLMAAAVIGGYMAINIGANDVANNVGPAVGSGALSLGAAVLMAAVFEAGVPSSPVVMWCPLSREASLPRRSWMTWIPLSG